VKQFDLRCGRRAAAQSFGAPYENMPEIGPIGVRIGKYMDLAEQAKAPERGRLISVF